MNSDGSNSDQEVKDTCLTCDTTCQRCQKGKMVHVVFGYITNQMLEDEAAGSYALGGCLMSTGPVHRCNACGASVGGDELLALVRSAARERQSSLALQVMSPSQGGGTPALCHARGTVERGNGLVLRDFEEISCN